MKVGTKTLLFGSHQFILHPIFVMAAWTKLYGWTWDPRVWVAAIVHDWGYWGKPDIDGKCGKRHPILGGRIMMALFGGEWSLFSMGHSRDFAERWNTPLSKLAAADKLAGSLMPTWLINTLALASGEMLEYVGKVSWMEGYRRNKEWQERNLKVVPLLKEIAK